RIVLRAENDFVFESPANGRLKPFRPADEREPTFYLGVTLPPGSRPPRRALSLYFGLVEPLFGNASTSVNERPELKAEYWNGRDWQVLLVDDGTTSLTRPGIVEFQPPADFAAREEFGLARHWVRVRWVKGAYRFKPRARRLLLNTTMALQAVTLNNEVLGSSDGSKAQKFRATQTPILLGQRLEVRELEMPSAAELEVLAREEDGEAMTLVLDAAGNPTEIWVRWHETPDFYGSGPRSRHYVLDHLTGEIRFGDGLNGLIPPIGSGNLRLAHYQTGGGSAGNRPAGAIIQMKTTVPYVHAVTNPEAALGGAEAEGLKSLLARAPRTLRHHGRAVTTEDYEDLALLASSEVARARCVPLRNLIDTPLMSEALEAHPINSPGEVSVIIVPRSTAPKPLPSLELIRRVQEYLEAHSVPTANLRVTGPLYLRVNVEVDVVPVSIEGAGAVAQAVQQSLADFLHPLTGGLDEQGWEFGREPHQSDLYALIESVPGVDHVHRLREPLREVDERDRIALKIDPGGAGAAQIIKDTGRFLVYSGTHTVNLRFEE
ncbi:MAG TPA: putative baseplate assembly protein, partial [Blastocatellia bacterium]|nr:putative baseplate assembly protein [Blastocatellia bacterium]